MASLNGQPCRSIAKEIYFVPFSFAPNAGGAVDNLQNRGEGIASVTRTGVGVFDVVLRHVWARFEGYTPSLQLNADADATVSSWNYVPATRTLTIRTRTAGAAADIAANANNRLGGILALKNSSVGR